MKLIKKIKSGGYYLLQGRCTANSNFIEDIEEAKLFLYYCNQYLGKYMKIHDFVITKDGWVMLVKVKSKKTILKYYHERIHGNIKGGRKILTKVWQIVSDQIRQFLSVFVRVTNRIKGRTGAKVHSVFERYIFGSLEEANQVIEKIRKRNMNLAQKTKKYQGKDKDFEISKKELKGSVFLGSRRLNRRKWRKKMRLKCYSYMDVSQLVAKEWIQKTLKQHLLVKCTQFLHRSQ